MSGTQLSSAALDERRRRLLFRSWHRGMREMDLLMGNFADAFLAGMSEAEVDAFEFLSDADDRELLSWLTSQHPVPTEYDTQMFHRILAYHLANPLANR